MGQLSLAAAAAAMALFGWGWLRGMPSWIKHPFASREVRVEQELKDKGVIKSDGTVSTGTEFDADLNALSKDLDSAQDQAESELDSAEQE